MVKKSGVKRSIHWKTILLLVLLVLIGFIVAWLMSGSPQLSPYAPTRTYVAPTPTYTAPPTNPTIPSLSPTCCAKADADEPVCTGLSDATACNSLSLPITIQGGPGGTPTYYQPCIWADASYC